jgi:DNA modification methylase
MTQFLHAYKAIDVAALKAWDRNARTHTPAQVQQLRASIREFGFTNPVLIDEEGLLIAGHGRRLAALEEGLQQVPAIEVRGLSNKQKRALALADNQLALNAGWDEKLLQAELGTLTDEGFDLSIVGFDPAEVARIMQTTGGNTDPDDAPPSPKRAVSRHLDLWVMGRHRLLCGDATTRYDYERLLAGEAPAMVWTDPPYGVNVSGKGGKAIEGDITNTAISGFFPLVCELLSPGGAIYMCGGSSNVALYSKLYEIHCRMVVHLIVWDKGHFVLRRHGYHSQFELVFYGWTQGGGRIEDHWYGDRKQPDVWSIKRDGTNDMHPTQKPVELVEIAVERSAPVGGIVLEPFCGSGSAIIACERAKRRCYALEIDPVYVDVAVERWQQFTGIEARLESNGQTFAEAREERHAQAKRTA